MKARKIRHDFRLEPEAAATLLAIAEAKGWTATNVVEEALAQLGKRTLGRRLADLVAIKLRAVRGQEGPAQASTGTPVGSGGAGR